MSRANRVRVDYPSEILLGNDSGGAVSMNRSDTLGSTGSALEQVDAKITAAPGEALNAVSLSISLDYDASLTLFADILALFCVAS